MKIGRMVLVCVVALALAGGSQAQTNLQRIENLLATGDNAQAHELAEQTVKELPDEPMAWFLLARARHAVGDLGAAIEAGKRATDFPGVRASSYYNLACAYALTGRRDEAFAALHEAKRAGFANRILMSTDPDLESLRGDPRFVLPVERIFDVLDVGDTHGLPYSVDLPPDFDPSVPHPVLLGPGEAEPNPEQPGSLFWGEDAVQRGWIVVESPAFVSDAPVEKTRKLLDHIASVYNVEGGKFHVAGFSSNSAGAFHVAMAMPERFHSVTGLPGHPVTSNDADLAKLKGVIVSFIVGENDAIWLEEARAAHETLRLQGVETYLEVIPGGGHVLQELFGGEFMERLDALRAP